MLPAVGWRLPLGVVPLLTRTSFLQRGLKSLSTRAWKVFILVRTAYRFLFLLFVSSDMERVLNDGGAGDVLPPPSSTQQINGDWVLFHPVYSPEELKAVDVSSH
jgi:hypothetical protein